MPNYYNPASFKPNVGFTPTGALGGRIAGEDRERYNSLMDMFETSQGYDLSKQGTELNEFMQAAPQRALEGQAKMATSRSVIDNVGPQAAAKTMDLQGIGNQSRLKAKMDEEMFAQNLMEKMAKSKSSVKDEEWKQGMAVLREAAAIQALAEQDPSYSPDGQIPLSASSQLNGRGELAQMLSKAGPKSGKILALMAKLDPAHITKMAEQAAKDKEQMDRQKYASDKQFEGTKYTADSSAAWHNADIAMRQQKEETIKKLELEIARLGKLDSEGKLGKQEKAYLKFLLEREFALKQAGAMVGPGVGAAMIGGETGARMQGAISGPATLPSDARQPQGAPRTFATEEEALASGYKGPAIINGRPARID